MNYRDLEAVRQIVHNATGLDITYAYEDLVFPEHGAFIIQFDEKNNNQLFCYFNFESAESDRINIFSNLKNECMKKKAGIEMKGAYTLKQEGEEIQIQFLN